MIQLILSDLDETLLNDDGSIHQKILMRFKSLRKMVVILCQILGGHINQLLER